MWEAEARIGDYTWPLRDFGDLLPWHPDENTLIDELKGPIVERNQRLLIHTAAGIVCGKDKVSENARRDVQKLASSSLSQVYLQGKLCLDPLGELPPSSSLIRVELRARAHDVCHKNHDKDNRPLLRFPIKELERKNIGIVEASPSFRFTTHTYLANEAADDWVVLIPYRNHMRLAAPPSIEDREDLFLSPTAISFMLGRSTLLPG